MKWLIIIVVAGFLYYRFVLVKSGNLKFWKFARENPEKAYSFFMENDAFIVFESKPIDSYKANIPSGEWDGPFKLHIPSINKFVTIFGRQPEYQTAQEKFMRSLHE